MVVGCRCLQCFVHGLLLDVDHASGCGFDDRIWLRRIRLLYSHGMGTGWRTTTRLVHIWCEHVPLLCFAKFVHGLRSQQGSFSSQLDVVRDDCLALPVVPPQRSEEFQIVAFQPGGFVFRPLAVAPPWPMPLAYAPGPNLLTPPPLFLGPQLLACRWCVPSSTCIGFGIHLKSPKSPKRFSPCNKTRALPCTATPL